jgi:hypothetical protein
MEATRSCETSGFAIPTRRYKPEDGIIQEFPGKATHPGTIGVSLWLWNHLLQFLIGTVELN